MRTYHFEALALLLTLLVVFKGTSNMFAMQAVEQRMQIQPESIKESSYTTVSVLTLTISHKRF